MLSIQPFRSRPRSARTFAVATLFALLLVACGDAAEETAPESAGDEAAGAEESADAAPGGDVLIVATTSILGDIVETLVGDDGTVEVLMPPGVDPHGYEPSARDAATLREADLVVANGLLLEENLVSALEAAEEDGVRVFELADKLDPIDFDWDGPHSHGHDDGHDDGHEDHGDEEEGHSHGDEEEGHGHGDEEEGHGHDDEEGHGHGDEEEGHSHGDEDHGHEDEEAHGHDEADDGHDDHGHGPEDPHIWFDPVRMATGVQLIAEELAALDTGVDAEEWERRGQDYADMLMELHDEIDEILAVVPPANRQLVTNHDALGYLAARYDFEVLGTVIPGSTTQAEADAQGFAELIETVEQAGVPAVFAENTDSTTLAEQLASEVIGRGDLEVEVVRVYTDALGEEGSGAETYPGLLRTTATRIADALG
jgi:zinc/manganese transport system substrate-binding protein